MDEGRTRRVHRGLVRPEIGRPHGCLPREAPRTGSCSAPADRTVGRPRNGPAVAASDHRQAIRCTRDGGSNVGGWWIAGHDLTLDRCFNRADIQRAESWIAGTLRSEASSRVHPDLIDRGFENAVRSTLLACVHVLLTDQSRRIHRRPQQDRRDESHGEQQAQNDGKYVTSLPTPSKPPGSRANQVCAHVVTEIKSDQSPHSPVTES